MNKSLIYSILVSFYLLFVSCSEDEPLQANTYIDPELIGEWYFIDTLTPNIPSPEYSFRGFQINRENQMIELGIETNSGMVAYVESPTIDSIIFAYNGKMLLNRFWWGGLTDTVNYIVDFNKLIMKMHGTTYIYNKSRLTNQIFDPVVSDVLLKIDSISVMNFKVFRYPSAYLSKKEHSSIYLFANISLSSTISSAMISVEINNFNGIGEYIIPYNQGKFMLVEGDVVMVFSSDSSITNTILIDQFDEANKYCSGSFSFSIGDQTIELRDGTFIVPIYK